MAAQALEVIPYTLAENAGLHPIAIVTGMCPCFPSRFMLHSSSCVLSSALRSHLRGVWCVGAELRKQHAEGKTTVGINVRHSTISDLTEENVLQPLLVNLSALSLATETVCMILKIDDMVVVR